MSNLERAQKVTLALKQEMERAQATTGESREVVARSRNAKQTAYKNESAWPKSLTLHGFNARTPEPRPDLSARLDQEALSCRGPTGSPGVLRKRAARA